MSSQNEREECRQDESVTHLEILDVTFPRRTQEILEIGWVLPVARLEKLHGLFGRDATFGTSQEECRDCFLPNASSCMRR